MQSKEGSAKMENHPTSCELIDGHFLGTLSESETELLDRLLKEDPEARGAFRAAARLDSHLREAALETDGDDPKRSTDTSRTIRGPWTWAALATAAVLVVTAWILVSLTTKGSPVVAQVVELGGSLRWTGDGGKVQENLAKGQSLSGGTLESLSADSWIEIAFRDGSQVALSGRSSMTFSKLEGKKRIHLREGSLSADITKLDRNEPIRFITPTADAAVLGTQFTLRADAASTRLIVYEGKVRVTRLSDGSVQEVSADEFVVAALDTAEPFQVQGRQVHVDAWSSALPFGIEYGEWIPLQEGEFDPGSLHAKPLLWHEYGRHMLLHLAALSATNENHQTALLGANARVRVRGRLAEDAEVFFGLTTHFRDGGFGGKYIASKRLAGSGEFEVNLPITDFHRQYPCFPETLIGHQLIDWWSLTINHDAGLEIVSVELLAP